MGQAVSGPAGQPQIGQLVQKFKSGLQDIIMFSKAIKQAKPEAAQAMDQGIAMIMQGIRSLTGGGQPGPTAPQGSVPPPPQESPEQTPEAT